MMFQNDGLESAYLAKEWFSLNRLPKDKYEDLKSELKIRELKHRRMEASKDWPGHQFDESAVSTDEPSLEEARNEVSDSDVMPNLRQKSFSAFLRFLRNTPLFLTSVSHEPISIGRSIIEHQIPRKLDYPESLNWFFLDSNFLTVDVVRRLRILDAFKLIRDDINSNTPMAEFFGATNARIDRLMKMYPAYRELLPYEGMTVAIDKKHMPNESELSGWFLLDRDETEVEEKLAGGPRGRPRKQEEAAEAFEIRFPDGRGGYTWKEVTRILEEEMQIFVSIETLKSGLAASKNSENDTK